MRRNAGLGFLAVLLFVALTACGGEAVGNGVKPPARLSVPAAETNEVYVKAAELFQKTNCISCHGVNLEGRVGPSTNLQKAGASKTKEQIANKIANGGGGMPVSKSKLSEDEMNLLADWLSSKK